ALNFELWFYALRFTLFAILVSLCFLNCPAAQAAEYYVDANIGDNANPGTSALPWKTLSRAYPNATSGTPYVQAGDTVILRNGQYGSFSLSNYSGIDWIIYKADIGHSPELSRITIESYPEDRNAYLRFEGLTVRAGAIFDKGVIQLRHSSYVQYKGLVVFGYGYEAIHNIESAKGFYFWQASDNVTIDNCTIKRGSLNESRLAEMPTATTFQGFTTGIYSDSDNLTVTGCEIADCYTGILAGGDNLVINNNKIHNLGSDGIVIGGVNNLTLRNNEIYGMKLYAPVLAEVPTETTWSEDGTIMYNPNAKWKTLGDNLLAPNLQEVYVVSGINVNTGDNEVLVAEVVSDTEVRFNKSIKLSSGGAAPSNVNYQIRSVAHLDLVQFNKCATGIQGAVISGNKFYFPHGQVVWWNSVSPVDGKSANCTDFLIENNLFVGDFDSADGENYSPIRVGATVGVIFRNNTVIGRLDFVESSQIQVYNNIISYAQWSGSSSDIIREDHNLINRGSGNYNATTIFYDAAWDNPNFYALFKGGITARDNPGEDSFQHASDNTDAIGFSSLTDYASIDILGVSRGDVSDAGCYQYSVASVILGDISGDSALSAYDAALAARIAVGLDELGDKLTVADVSGDKQVTAYDAALIAQRAVGLISKFPVEG
ncbi:MAG: right-handed parallel beta-helix repeat-containing protein, partial [Candidatus Omnitrophica bacterium]|nr:right-handed parallel beta-helix repeat-containing protein [Candidatus Omnitrophota bacterium]